MMRISPNANTDSKIMSELKGRYRETKTAEVLAKEVIDGKWGQGRERKSNLERYGFDYDKVQSKVNEILYPDLAPVRKTRMVTELDKTLKGWDEF